MAKNSKDVKFTLTKQAWNCTMDVTVKCYSRIIFFLVCDLMLSKRSVHKLCIPQTIFNWCNRIFSSARNKKLGFAWNQCCIWNTVLLYFWDLWKLVNSLGHSLVILLWAVWSMGLLLVYWCHYIVFLFFSVSGLVLPTTRWWKITRACWGNASYDTEWTDPRLHSASRTWWSTWKWGDVRAIYIQQPNNFFCLK